MTFQRLFFSLLIVSAVFYVFVWEGKVPEPDVKNTFSPISGIEPNRDFPLSENKSFVVVLYGYNQSEWVERALHSLFQQDYDYYRIIFIDDDSLDQTAERAKDKILESNQTGRVLVLNNESHLGPLASLYRAIDKCLDREIVFFMEAKDWLSSELVLSRLNAAYQNPDVWLTTSASISYPAYQIDAPAGFDDLTEKKTHFLSFYAALFRKIQLKDLFIEGDFFNLSSAYAIPLWSLSGGRVRKIEDPLIFTNTAAPELEKKLSLETFQKEIKAIASYEPLSDFPQPVPGNEKVDIVLFSYDRPMQLYSTIESVTRYFSGFENISVLYRASDQRYVDSYIEVNKAFPSVQFIKQSSEPKKDFKPLLLDMIGSGPSKYILFGVDDIMAKDFVNLGSCIEMMERTGAYGFYLRFGKHINYCYMHNRPQEIPKSIPLSSGIYAWDTKYGELDWGFPKNVDMTIYRKADIAEEFETIKFKNPNSLESHWSQTPPANSIGLYFEESKIVNIPLNMVNPSDCRHMNFASTEDLLVKFNEGLKIDINSLYRIENPSPHMEVEIDFCERYTNRNK